MGDEAWSARLKYVANMLGHNKLKQVIEDEFHIDQIRDALRAITSNTCIPAPYLCSSSRKQWTHLLLNMCDEVLARFEGDVGRLQLIWKEFERISGRRYIVPPLDSTAYFKPRQLSGTAGQRGLYTDQRASGSIRHTPPEYNVPSHVQAQPPFYFDTTGTPPDPRSASPALASLPPAARSSTSTPSRSSTQRDPPPNPDKVQKRRKRFDVLPSPEKGAPSPPQPRSPIPVTLNEFSSSRVEPPKSTPSLRVSESGKRKGDPLSDPGRFKHRLVEPSTLGSDSPFYWPINHDIFFLRKITPGETHWSFNFSRKGKSSFVTLRMFQARDTPVPGFPEDVQIFLNNKKVNSSLPWFISPRDATNTITVKYLKTREDYWCLAQEVRRVGKTEIIERAKVLPLEEAKANIINSFKSNTDIVDISRKISLKDPCSRTSIKLPARSNACEHLSVFDLNIWLTMVERANKFHCPQCHHKIYVEDIIIDSFFKDIIEQVGDSEDIIIYPDATWTPHIPSTSLSPLKGDLPIVKHESAVKGPPSSTIIDLTDGEPKDLTPPTFEPKITFILNAIPTMPTSTYTTPENTDQGPTPFIQPTLAANPTPAATDQAQRSPVFIRTINGSPPRPTTLTASPTFTITPTLFPTPPTNKNTKAPTTKKATMDKNTINPTRGTNTNIGESDTNISQNPTNAQPNAPNQTQSDTNLTPVNLSDTELLAVLDKTTDELGNTEDLVTRLKAQDVELATLLKHIAQIPEGGIEIGEYEVKYTRSDLADNWLKRNMEARKEFTLSSTVISSVSLPGEPVNYVCQLCNNPPLDMRALYTEHLYTQPHIQKVVEKRREISEYLHYLNCSKMSANKLRNERMKKAEDQNQASPPPPAGRKIVVKMTRETVPVVIPKLDPTTLKPWPVLKTSTAEMVTSD